MVDDFALEKKMKLIQSSFADFHHPPLHTAAKENQLDIALLVSSAMATQSNQLHIL